MRTSLRSRSPHFLDHREACGRAASLQGAPRAACAASTTAPARTASDDGLDLGREVTVGARPGHAEGPDGAQHGAGRRRGLQRRAQIERARRRRGPRWRAPGPARRARAAACAPAAQPIETWSSCIADDGIESTLAGTASRLSSATIPAAVYWAIIEPGVDARVVGEERRQAVAAGDVEEPVGAALAHRGHVGDRDREEVEDVPDRRAVEVAVRLDPAVEGDARGCRWPRPARGAATAAACSRVSRAAPCTCGAQRSE